MSSAAGVIEGAGAEPWKPTRRMLRDSLICRSTSATQPGGRPVFQSGSVGGREANSNVVCAEDWAGVAAEVGWIVAGLGWASHWATAAARWDCGLEPEACPNRAASCPKLNSRAPTKRPKSEGAVERLEAMAGFWSRRSLGNAGPGQGNADAGLEPFSAKPQTKSARNNRYIQQRRSKRYSLPALTTGPWGSGGVGGRGGTSWGGWLRGKLGWRGQARGSRSSGDCSISPCGPATGGSILGRFENSTELQKVSSIR